MNVNSAPQPSSLPLRCADVAPYLSAYADGELAQPLRSQIAAHLDTCESCSAQLARYARIDAALMTLSRTAPSPAVFERIAAAVATHPSEPAVRESLRERRRLPLRRVIELQQWGEDDSPAALAPARRSPLPRWAAAGLPAIAAILLVAFTAVALRGLGMRMPPVVTQPTCGVTGDPVALTQSKMLTAALGKTMSFTTVSPTYVPGAPTLRCVTAQVLTDPSGNGALFLDVTWTLSGPVTQIHLREGPSESAWYGYVPSSANNMTWQVGANQWTPLIPIGGSGKLAVGEKRDGMWLAMDATAANSGNGALASAQTTLRLMSLSMDLPYQPLPVQSIIPAPTNLIYHVTGRLVGSSGTVDGYYEPTQHESLLNVQTSDSYFTDIISDQQGIRLDKDTHTYQQLPPASLLPATLDPFGQQVFYGADTDASQGLLWYVGPATYNGADAYKFLLVEAPRVTDVYVDASSKQVEAVVVDTNSSAQPGGADAPSWFTNDACINYSLVEYVKQNSSISFSPEPPSDYHSGAVPSSITCATNIGQASSQ